jgi:predicted GTPase
MNEKLRNCISRSSIRDDQNSTLLKMVKDRQRPPYEVANVRVMLNGEAGQGKSFTVNNILGHVNLCAQASKHLILDPEQFANLFLVWWWLGMHEHFIQVSLPTCNPDSPFKRSHLNHRY